MKRRWLMAALILVMGATTLTALQLQYGEQNWITVKSSTKNSIEVISQSHDAVVLELNLGGFYAQEVRHGDEVYQKLIIPGGGFTNEIGKPEVATIGKFLAVPRGATIDLEILDYEYTVLPGYEVLPAQEPLPDLENVAEPPFKRDEETYTQDKDYPGVLAEFSPTSTIRGVEVTDLLFYPLNYNPAKKELKVYNRIRVKVNFHHGSNFSVQRLRSPFFEPLLKRLLGNYASLEPFNLNRDLKKINTGLGVEKSVFNVGNGADMLIITADEFYDDVLPLAEWRHQMGIITKVVKLSDIGPSPSADDIIDYIQTAYNNWELPPTFVMIVGDVEYVPTNYKYRHPFDNLLIGTDVYYGEMDESFIPFPDLFVGRLSVDNTTQLQTIVNKILNYELDPYTGENWFNNLLLAAYEESGRFFVATCESIYVHLSAMGYNIDRQYEGGYPPGSTQGVINAINNGVIIANHRDHGDSRNYGGYYDGWSHPQFTTSNVNSLTNGAKLPMFFSLNCNSGWFDGETDEQSYNYECLGEELMRAQGKGAIGWIGSTRVSYSGYNDELDKGLIDAIWANFDPSYPTDTSTNPLEDPIYYMGAVINYGKYWMYDIYALPGGCPPYPWTPSPEKTRTEFEEFNYLGDPAFQIFTAMPESMVVSYPPTVPVGPSQLVVSVSDFGGPIEGALVSVSQYDTLVHDRGFTDASGQVILDINPVTPDPLKIVVTYHDKFAHIGTILPIAEGPYVGYLKKEINDSGGDGVVNPGEDVDMTIWLKNYGSEPTYGVYALLNTDDSYVSISVDSAYYGDMAPDDSSSGSNPYQFSVDISAPDKHVVSFELPVISAEGDTWVSHPSVMIKKPILEYVDRFIDDPDSNHFPEPGEDFFLYVDVRNTGSATAYSAQAVLTMDPDPYVEIADSTVEFGDILPDSTKRSLSGFSILIDPLCPDPYQVYLYITMNTGAFTYYDTFLLKIRGKGFFDDMEYGEGDWTHGGSGDLWHITEHRSNSPTHSWYCGVEGSWQYNNSMNAWLMTPEIALYPESKLVFYTYYNLETNYDYGYVEISTDGGNTWEQLGESFNGISGGWIRVERDLRDYTGAVYIRFRMTSDAYVTYEGWYIDDVSVEPFLYPDIDVSPLSFNVVLAPDTVDTQWLRIFNYGEAPLFFTLRDSEWAEVSVLTVRKGSFRKTFGSFGSDRSRGSIKVNSEGKAFVHVEPAKGEPDPFHGIPQLENHGGPDDSGYTWVDSDEPGGPVYNWIDITSSGTPLYLSDDSFVTVSLPFPFLFYGSIKTSMKICSNGYLTFGVDGSDYTNDPIPDTTDPDDFIAPFWDDLNPSSGGQIYYYYDAENEQFIVEWYQVPHWGGGGTYTFEAILYPDGHVLYQYESMSGNLTSATIGLENSTGTVGLQVVYNASYVHDSLAVWLGQNLGWLTEHPLGGEVAVGEYFDVALVFNTEGLEVGNYGALLHVFSNDPDENPVDVTINMTVGTYILGDVNADGNVDYLDVLYLANYLFAGGPAPNPLESGDLNHDGNVDSNDLVMLANIVFGGGSAPSKGKMKRASDR